jgi:surfeit locus 1 family protein
MLVVLLGLGTWQLRRLAWKERLLDQIDHAEQLPAIPMPADPSPFAKAEVSGRLREDLSAVYGAELRDTRDGPTLGGQLIVPLQRAGQETILVDRGWVPMSRPQPLSPAPGTTVVDGYVRPAEHAGLFSAADDPVTRRFYTLDPQAIGRSLGLAQVAPFTLVALGPAPPDLYPDPARRLPQPPNNHLQYALTWYGLAAVLAVIFFVHARRVLRS